ncbi:MAG: hypothetical protein AAB549_00930, partial [Patescibacteria group bacterium]
YILDPIGKRVVAFTKNGNFINQYVHDTLGNATAMTVDERNQKIYVLIGQTIQALTLQKAK